MKVWIRAESSDGASTVDLQKVYIDTSPPTIDKVKLIRGEDDLFSIEDAFEVASTQLIFDVWDPQSGIQEVSWSLDTTRGGDRLGYEKKAINQHMVRTIYAMFRKAFQPIGESRSYVL